MAPLARLRARVGSPSGAAVALLIASVVTAAAVACGGDSEREPGESPAGPVTGDGGVRTDDGAPPVAVEVPACIEASGRDAAASRALEDGAGSATVTVEGAGCARTFTLASTAARRDDEPKSPRVLRESPSGPTLSTRSDLFDALYQLALAEAKENSVDSIQDGAFRSGAPLPCGGCFETGRKWTYVWTRDTSYAVDLGLGFVDPLRAKASLDLKLSTRRDGSDLQIVQDTGTGGSYPVSTDRAVWALGARELLAHLTGEARTQFRDRALTAIANTEEHDRAVVFDAKDGLYRGEQSFLDWRSQSYPGWTVPDVVNIATSKSLGTNAAHLALLETGAELAVEKGDTELAQKLRTRADALRAAMRQKLWLAEDAQFSTYLTTELDPAPARRFDLLGTSLAVLLDVATPEQGRAALASYPTLPKGPPVIFPQQKETAIYHNRAIWPFVTAYWVRAARKVGNDAAFEAGVRSLVRGSALFLSNMENLEVVTGKPWVEDGAYSGPVVNSQRQLWSVGGYLGMVHAGLFGIETRAAGLRVAPFVPKTLRRTMFGASDALVLNDLPFRGKKLSVVVKLPPASDGAGAYAVSRVRLNGVEAADGVVDEARLAARNLVEVELAEPAAGAASSVRTIADLTDYRVLYAPRTPAVTSVTSSGGKLVVGLDLAGEAAADVTVSIYRDGVRVAKDLPGATASWQDAATAGESSPSHCYTAELRYPSGNVSQRARPACFWGAGNARITSIPATSFTITGGTMVTAYGRTFQEAWGDPGHTLAGTFTATRSGEHLVQAVYGNGAGSLETGVTCAVKRVVVEEVQGGAVVASGYLIMPQRGTWDAWGDSSFVRATLVANKSYRVRLEADARSVNMSAFQHFADYTGGTGGTGGAFSRVNVAELKILSLAP